MNTHPANALWRGLTRQPVQTEADTARDQQEAVANAIGCQEWVGRCDRRGECFCATAARAVVQIERLAGSAS